MKMQGLYDYFLIESQQKEKNVVHNETIITVNITVFLIVEKTTTKLKKLPLRCSN